MTAFEKSFAVNVAPLIAKTRNASGVEAVKKLKGQLRAAASIASWSFNASSKEATAWAREHAAELVKGTSKTTRDDLQAIIGDALAKDELDSAQLADDIAAALGDDARAELIARTETIAASIAGQQEAWDQAVTEGFLTGNELQEWIVTDDDHLCPVCEPLDGVQAALGEMFEVDGDEIDGPPAHPNCRCDIGLVLPSE